MSELPFSRENNVPDFIECVPDIQKPEILKLHEVKISDNLQFMDRILPPTKCKLLEHPVFNRAYFLDLHESVKLYDTNNYRGARIPLKHNNINVECFRNYLVKFSYPHSHILQYVE